MPAPKCCRSHQLRARGRCKKVVNVREKGGGGGGRGGGRGDNGGYNHKRWEAMLLSAWQRKEATPAQEMQKSKSNVPIGGTIA